MAAMARWPDVPHVYGWMSLSEQGHWRLHPNADAWQPSQSCEPPFAQGEPIESVQIRSFIERNYASDQQGNWYFQNGPQRVYVRLDAAPYILHTGDTPLSFQTHNGLAVKRVESWWLDDEGRFYATTEHGPALITGRDLPSVVEALCTSDGQPLITALESLDPATLQPVSIASPKAQPMHDGNTRLPAIQVQTPEHPATSESTSMLYFCPATRIAEQLGFVRCPKA